MSLFVTAFICSIFVHLFLGLVSMIIIWQTTKSHKSITSVFQSHRDKLLYVPLLCVRRIVGEFPRILICGTVVVPPLGLDKHIILSRFSFDKSELSNIPEYPLINTQRGFLGMTKLF